MTSAVRMVGGRGAAVDACGRELSRACAPIEAPPCGQPLQGAAWARCARSVRRLAAESPRTPPSGGDSCLRPCRVIGARVDALVIAYVVDFERGAGRERGGEAPRPGQERREGFLKAIGRAARAARKTGRPQAFRWGKYVEGDLRPPTRPGVYTIENAECSIRIERNARSPIAVGGATEPAWNVEIEWRATSLATRGPDVHLSAALAGELGWVKAERLRRVDLAATMTGWNLDAAEADRLVLRSRAKVERWTTAEARTRRADATIAVHGSARRATGYSVSPGNPVMARVYDKLEELRVKRDLVCGRDGRWKGITPKGEIELAAWRKAGAHPEHGHDVARVEFQVRGEALDEFQLRNPGDLDARIPALWAYLTGEAGAEERKGAHKGWMRLVTPQTRGQANKRRRAAVDPRWTAVRAARFPSETDAAGTGAAVRVRRMRRGAHYLQALGASLSMMASAGLLPPVPCGPRGETTMAPATAARYLRGAFDDVARQLARAWAELLIADKGETEAAAWLIERTAAVRARFAQIEWDSAQTRRRRLLDGPSLVELWATWTPAQRAAFRIAS